MKTWSRLQTTYLARSVVVTSTTPPVCLFVQEQGAEKKVINRTARAWYKRYAL